ncbi:hypothetical protein Pmani_010334 [Petrolisthes manimaculis]|uniref:Uncharacterized protein n=1 Tax=Petrolisthes manimaculis TaxID=1843537 RepID=A0AAE1Q297_9EUCA|nr:hypothetical protein Pmani_010334 [Petrolisthes manimaculis]
MNLTKPQYCKVKRHLGSIDDETPGTRGSHTSSLAPKIWITDWMALLSHLQVKSYTGGTRDKRGPAGEGGNKGGSHARERERGGEEGKGTTPPPVSPPTVLSPVSPPTVPSPVSHPNLSHHPPSPVLSHHPPSSVLSHHPPSSVLSHHPPSSVLSHTLISLTTHRPQSCLTP